MSEKKKEPHALNKTQRANVVKWIKALRSGKYKQADGQLRIGDPVKGAKYCCLGVACEVTRTIYQPSCGSLPNAGVKKLGIANQDGEVDDYVGKTRSRSLVSLNDDAGWSFKRIARFVESELKTNKRGLFVTSK